MKKAILIADGGGTKVDWCILEESGERTFFQTDTYHPYLINDEWINSKRDFWKNYTDKYDLSVYFYGSGCSLSKNQDLLRSAFTIWGINSKEINSDLVGAALATLGETNGYVGILGTGSVLAKIENKKAEKIHGGFGYILGDEGSGYYFGKLVLRELLLDNFSKELSSQLNEILGNREAIMAKVYGPESRKFISSISYLLKGVDKQEVKLLHKENLELFARLYVPKSEIKEPIHFIGSYAKNHEDILSEILIKNGLVLGSVIEKPIGELTNYFVRSTF